jgi:hypothetical protein
MKRYRRHHSVEPLECDEWEISRLAGTSITGPAFFGGSGGGTPPAWSTANIAPPLSLANSNKQIVLAAGNVSVSVTAHASRLISSGKWYWEVKCDHLYGGGNSTTNGFGIAESGFNFATGNLGSGSTANSVALWASGLFYASGTGTSTGLGGITDGTIVMFSVDIGAGKLWLGLGGVWSGDPASGTSPFYSGLSTSVSYYPACTPWSADGINVGLTIQGDGNNSYPPPAGFTLYTV